MVKDKRVYLKKIDHSNDLSYENEVKFDSVNSPAHYMHGCLLYTSPSPRDRTRSRMPSSA